MFSDEYLTFQKKGDYNTIVSLSPTLGTQPGFKIYTYYCMHSKSFTKHR